jgi:1-phosphofructokinase/tagatose 6-phosphate kinase
MDAVNRTRTYRLDVSGKGINVSRVLTQLGKSCLHLTQLGGAFCPLFLKLCKQDGLAIEWVESDSSIRFCYTLIHEADSSVTELVEESEPVGAGTEARLREAYMRLIPHCQRLIISGSLAAGFSPTLVPYMVCQAKEAGKELILDIRGKELLDSLAYNPDIIKPNLFEFALTFAPDLVQGNRFAEDPGAKENIKRRIRAICLELNEKYHCRIILTRGNAPIWYTDSGHFGEFAFEQCTPVNTTGSGDAFTAGLAAALEEGASFRDGIAAGVHCGSSNARHLKVGSIL